jgi:hypothetical protein
LTESTQCLDTVVAEARDLQAVRKQDVQPGDRLLVRTRNSTYLLWCLSDGVYWVSGGWFDREGMSPQVMGINGCTWGGSIIKQDIVAALGLRLEFGNRVRTTAIRDIRMVRASTEHSLN